MDQLVGRWRDNKSDVVNRLIGAAEALDQVPFVFHAGRLRRHIARLLTIDGDRDGAARELRRAHDVFLRLGAALELRLTREAMRQLGVRPPQKSVVQGGTLTQREREVAELVAQHKTNKEIPRALEISARTVSTHLSNVFLKLGRGFPRCTRRPGTVGFRTEPRSWPRSPERLTFPQRSSWSVPEMDPIVSLANLVPGGT